MFKNLSMLFSNRSLNSAVAFYWNAYSQKRLWQISLWYAGTCRCRFHLAKPRSFPIPSDIYDDRRSCWEVCVSVIRYHSNWCWHVLHHHRWRFPQHSQHLVVPPLMLSSEARTKHKSNCTALCWNSCKRKRVAKHQRTGTGQTEKKAGKIRKWREKRKLTHRTSKFDWTSKCSNCSVTESAREISAECNAPRKNIKKKREHEKRIAWIKTDSER